ncbi:hypothetical protein CONPUDRAFT_147829 [Coniophora puteana RWD-64-598 SS2]|uniref:Uncharacterized protein n=1 Tax=Coniophora puteana (strain RWD-64-598) TaxID=741705 RepID=R7SDH1_CONPW|nr:uncharacterized protein CONPUDRAFT_147829 [Coniophora puteana RWD-64-598 SS2]EIW74203.1 hypothetical protein CONPUDRAFT_147829 [Coniophora puteana RWD-64-598 SS2]
MSSLGLSHPFLQLFGADISFCRSNNRWFLDTPLAAVLVTVLHAISAITTIGRLYLRVRFRRFRWDDGWAALGLSVVISDAITAWFIGTSIIWELDCIMPMYISYVDFPVNIVASVVMVLTLLWMARNLSKDRKSKVLVKCFGGSVIFTCVATAVHLAYVPNASFLGGVTIDIQGTVELCSCNILAFVVFGWKLLNRGDDLELLSETQVQTGRQTHPSKSWTTVDLDELGPPRSTSCSLTVNEEFQHAENSITHVRTSESSESWQRSSIELEGIRVAALQLNKTLKVETRMSRSLPRRGVHVQSGKTTQPPFSRDLQCLRAVNELCLGNSHKNSPATQ